MISARDVVLGLFCAWRLFLFDRGAVHLVDATADGFWKSFYAAVIVLPAALILHMMVVRNSPELFSDAATSRIVSVFAVEYVYQWLLFPVAMLLLTEVMGRERQYVAYIVARNWSHVIQVVIVLPAVIIFFAGGAESAGLGAFLLIAAYIVTAVYAWFIARSVLDITGVAAAVIVVIEIAITEMISYGGKIMIAAT